MTHIEQNHIMQEDLSQSIRIIEDLVKIDNDRMFDSAPCRIARSIILTGITISPTGKRLIKEVNEVVSKLSIMENCLEKIIRRHKFQLENFRNRFKRLHWAITNSTLIQAKESLQDRPDILSKLEDACDIAGEAFKKVSSTEELSKYALMLAQANAEAFLLLSPHSKEELIQQVLTIERLLDERAKRIG